MKVQIYSNDNGSGCNSTLTVYKHHFRDIYEREPLCVIEEDSFFDLLPDKQYLLAQNGKINFNVNQAELLNVSIKNF